MVRLVAIGVALVCMVDAARADGDPVRGKAALEGKAFIPGAWSTKVYDQAWKAWGVAEKPADYDAAFLDRYGLHPAPYPNGNLPMGLRESRGLLFNKAIAVDCMTCHGGSILGKSYVGLGNASLDAHALFQELSTADGINKRLPFRFSNVRGTNEAGAMGVYLLGLRNPNLTLRFSRQELGLHDDMCEDVPAWWLLKKKRTMYYTGGADARSVRSLMQFMMGSLNSRETFDAQEADFRDIQAYLLTLEAPKYPHPVDASLVKQGQAIFERTCASCHGTYGEKWTYPNRIVPLDEVGTDPSRFNGITPEYGHYYNRSWFAREKDGWFAGEFPARYPRGYQAPPLDGVWATAPYLHNGSVPTLYSLLKSSTRPKRYTRSFKTDAEAYDTQRVGWKVRSVPAGAEVGLPEIDARRIYDTTQPGRGNGGHTYGDELSEPERLAVLEYLKTL